MATKCIKDHAKGWLTVKWEDGNTDLTALSLGLKVDLTSTANGRDYFTVLEGVTKGRKGSVKRKDDGTSRLGDCAAGAAVSLRFDRAARKLYYGNGQQATAITNGNPMPNGTFDILIPDYYHDLADGHLGQSQFAPCWFRVADPANNTRYLHCGTVSDGCITVDPSKWTEIYNLIINARKNDQAVGTVKVEGVWSNAPVNV